MKDDEFGSCATVPHTFRHSAASFINAQTGNLKLAQKLLGHSTIDMTAEVYTHTSAEAEREAALAVGRAIYGDLFLNLFPTRNNSNVAAELGGYVGDFCN